MARILISAYSCSLGRGSEEEIGWHLVNELSKHHEIWVITRANNKASHDVSYKNQPKPSKLNYIYYDLPKWVCRLKQGKRFFLLYYYFWQLGLAFKLRKLVTLYNIELVHHLTGGMDWMPSGLALTSTPFILGPVGSENTHPYIWRQLPLKEKIKDTIRNVVRVCARKIDPFVRMTSNRATIILSHTPENIPKANKGKVAPFIQTGIQPNEYLATSKKELERSPTCNIIYAGALSDWKGSRLAVKAFLLFAQKKDNAHLTVIGDGPLRDKLVSMVNNSPYGSKVQFLGKVSMKTLNSELRKGDVFLYPSYHHGLATIVLQAMMSRLPVICIEGDATGRIVGDKLGITIKLYKDTNIEQSIANALLYLSNNEIDRQELAATAYTHVIRNHSYSHIAQAHLDIYSKILSKHSE